MLQCRVSRWHVKVASKGSKELHVAFNLVVMVALIRGQRVSLEADLTASAQSLAERARTALGVGRGRLFSSSCSILDGDAKLGGAKLQTGDCLMLQVGTIRIHGCSMRFAPREMGLLSHVAMQSGGGDSNSVQDQLKDVQQIQAFGSAFAAVLRDGSVVTGGNAVCG